MSLSVSFESQKIWLQISNKSFSSLSNFAFAIDKNYFGLTLASTPSFPQILDFAESIEVLLSVQFDQSNFIDEKSSAVRFALRTSNGVLFAITDIPQSFLLASKEQFESNSFSPNKI